MRYKNELFLIKGRYFTHIGFVGDFPLADYGAVEGGVVVDADDSAIKGRGFVPDVLLACHNGKWGVIPALEICSESSAVFASADSNPFTYDDYEVARSEENNDNQEPVEVFILLKKDGDWKAMRVEHGPSVLLEEEQPVSNTSEDLVTELDEKYSVHLHLQEKATAPDEKLPEFDIYENFLNRYIYNGKTIRLTKMLIGLEPYEYDKAFMFAAAHKEPYATILMGRELLAMVQGFSEKRDEADETRLARYDAMLETCKAYLMLGKQYAEEKGDATLADIAEALYDEACEVYTFSKKNRASRPLCRPPYLKKPR